MLFVSWCRSLQIDKNEQLEFILGKVSLLYSTFLNLVQSYAQYCTLFVCISFIPFKLLDCVFIIRMNLTVQGNFFSSIMLILQWILINSLLFLPLAAVDGAQATQCLPFPAGHSQQHHPQPGPPDPPPASRPVGSCAGRGTSCRRLPAESKWSDYGLCGLEGGLMDSDRTAKQVCRGAGMSDCLHNPFSHRYRLILMHIKLWS